MEKLKSLVPESLKQNISETTSDDLEATCSSLLSFFQGLPLFHQMVRDLSAPERALCRKNKEAALEAKSIGNECFCKGDYSNALRFYSQALRVCPIYVDDGPKNLLATLFVNRASSLHKLGLFVESLRDSTRALIVSPTYAKAWFRRAKANYSLGNYEDAISDLNASLKMETSLSGKRQIRDELNMILDQSVPRNGSPDKPNEDISDELLQDRLHCVSTPTKGRGMTPSIDIPIASLIHKEDPLAAIILKHCRETHCAFCFNELPADTVPCMSCSNPLYCSVQCQVQAGGQDFSRHVNNYEFPEDFTDDLQTYIRNVTSVGICGSKIEQAAEHLHECQGMHWPAVLPSDVVLAGRILVKCLQQQSYGGVDGKTHGLLDLCHNYALLPWESKLEFLVYSMILLYCLQQFCPSKIRLSSTTAAEIVMLLSQIRVNSMAIVCITYSDAKQPVDDDTTNPVQQIQVAQAIYSGGSLFNHSCQPNVHAYFISRTLFVRATEFVAAGSPLELSYGPQVGQWDCSERLRSLEERYSFICECSGCAQLNLSDLVHTGYRCDQPSCTGVVLDSHVAKFEKEKLKHFRRPNLLQKGHMHSSEEDIRNVARKVFEQTSYDNCFLPGHCLSCGSFCDLQALQKTIARAEIYVKRLQDAVASGEIRTDLIMETLKSVDSLRQALHPFSKKIAEVEDKIAQAFCLVGEMQAALDHCQASLQIMEKLYGENHIVIGNELIKLASIQLSVGHKSLAGTVNRLIPIFSLYYGSHADVLFPHIQFLKREAGKFVQ